MTTDNTTTTRTDNRPKRSLAVLGTGSDVGKSILVTGICRILRNNGVTVAPFKGQNMSNNAYPALLTTAEQDGYGEIGIAQAIQARACRQIPRVEMNPILLKSGGRRASDGAYLCSVFVLGKHFATEDFGALGERTETLLDLVVEAHARLPARTVIMEGAGSCTELNLMHRDVVNLPLVRRLQVPWILVANIDPGGVFAQIVGTKACVHASDWDLCAGIVVNKLRGEAKYFEPGPQILREMVGKPIFVIPFLDNINIAEEDGMGLERKLAMEHTIDEQADNKVRVVVICYPHISMTDDLLPVEQDKRFQVEWRRQHLPGLAPRAIVLPGSRQTRVDMEWLAESPWYKYVQDFVTQGGTILGLCGGYQMMGRTIFDPRGIESSQSGNKTMTPGLGLLAASTTLEPTKVVQGLETANIISCKEMITVEGYEIHSGRTIVEPDAKGSPLLRRLDDATEGWIDGSLAGTYFHGILESTMFRSWFFLDADERHLSGLETVQEDPIDRLAEHLASHGLDFETLSGMIGLT